MSTRFDEDYTRYQLDRSWLRRLVRTIYLRRARSLVEGVCLDFGCGVGELLARLPAESRGVEYNAASVELCQSKGLAVDWYDGVADDWQLSVLPQAWRFRSLVISHVLEHLDEPLDVLSRLLVAASARGAVTALVIVPGRAGYRIDSTHRTFVDRAMIESFDWTSIGWKIASWAYFPGNLARLGDVLAHHELQVVLRRSGSARP